MSWKMFGQIVLLIIIAALISAILKCGMMKSACHKGKFMQRHSQTMEMGR